MPITLLTLFVLTLTAFAADTPSKLGSFEGHNDVGTVLHPGSATYDSSAKTFSLSGAGDNMWLSNDAFHFVWKKISGDVELSAAIEWLGEGKNPHR